MMNKKEKAYANQIHNEVAKVAFDVIADTHVLWDLPDRTLYDCLEDIWARRIRHVVIAGDITANGYPFQYRSCFKALQEFPFSYAIALGNHDLYNVWQRHQIKLHPAYKETCLRQHHTLYYHTAFHGYSLYVLNSQKPQKNMAHFQMDQLDWLRTSLQHEDQEKPVFVICHQPLAKTHAHSDDPLMSVGPQSQQLEDILKLHPHVIYISGHIHNSYNECDIVVKDSLTLVNIPALKHVKYGEKRTGIGFHIRVFHDFIYLRTRDYKHHDWIESNEYIIDFQQHQVLSFDASLLE